MFFDPRALFMLAVLIGVSGWVIRGLMITRHRLSRGETGPKDKLDDMEERLRKLESATSSILIDITSMREKERFMAKLGVGVAPQDATRVEPRSQPDISPMVTQSIPISPRPRSPRT